MGKNIYTQMLMLFIPGKQDMNDCHFLLCNFPQYGYILFL